MKRIALAASLVAAFLLPWAAPARGGYRIEEVDPEFPDDVTTYWFQAGKVRIDGALEGLTMIVDVKAGEGWLIDQASRRYAGGPIPALAAELAQVDAQDEAPEAEPEPERDEAGPEEDEEPQEEPPPEKARVVEVKDLGAGERVLGYETRRHTVTVDGELVEELWLASKIDLAAEVDPVAFAAGMRQMLGDGMSAGQGYEENPTYRALRAGGYPLRQILYFVGEKSTLEARAVEVQSFPAADFAVPAGFTRVGYAELLLGEAE